MADKLTRSIRPIVIGRKDETGRTTIRCRKACTNGSWRSTEWLELVVEHLNFVSFWDGE